MFLIVHLLLDGLRKIFHYRHFLLSKIESSKDMRKSENSWYQTGGSPEGLTHTWSRLLTVKLTEYKFSQLLLEISNV